MENTDENHVVCSHYEPLKRRVISCEPESEWIKKQEILLHESIEKLDTKFPEVKGCILLSGMMGILNVDAVRELGKGHVWQDLQDVLAKMPYPKGTEYARIELDGKT
jgi:hypothetical protein